MTLPGQYNFVSVNRQRIQGPIKTGKITLKSKVIMKKQFTIKAVQTVKNIKLSAVKNESKNVLNFLQEAECCGWSSFHGLAPKANFSL
ncbi:hypothetical protein GCM10028817_09680 [Spirosoma pomorum]